MPNRIPVVKKFCGCIDLKTAVIIIAVLGIVTNPVVSWVVVRHSYVIHMSCVVTVREPYPDVVDINFHNILSLGLGANAGYRTSCFKSNSTNVQGNVALNDVARNSNSNSSFLKLIKYLRWVVLLADLALLVSCVVFIFFIFKGMKKKVFDTFLYSAIVSVALSFVYGITYVTVCASSGTGFPLFELFFAFFDLIVWAYFIIVIKSYRRIVYPTQT